VKKIIHVLNFSTFSRFQSSSSSSSSIESSSPATKLSSNFLPIASRLTSFYHHHHHLHHLHHHHRSTHSIQYHHSPEVLYESRIESLVSVMSDLVGPVFGPKRGEQLCSGTYSSTNIMSLIQLGVCAVVVEDTHSLSHSLA